MADKNYLRKPEWLKIKIPGGKEYSKIKENLRYNNLHTVCEEAKCPNIGECWSAGVATIMILGDTCTRACGFCNVKTGRPGFYDLEEPARVAESVANMPGLKYLTITSVNRDELDDQGSQVWFETIKAIRSLAPHVKVEVLTPDFRGNTRILDAVLEAKPDVFNHNMETVTRLQKSVRKMANWQARTSACTLANQVAGSEPWVIHGSEVDWVSQVGMMSYGVNISMTTVDKATKLTILADMGVFKQGKATLERLGQTIV